MNVEHCDSQGKRPSLSHCKVMQDNTSRGATSTVCMARLTRQLGLEDVKVDTGKEATLGHS